MGHGVEKCWARVRPNTEGVNVSFELDDGIDTFLSRREGLDNDDSVKVVVKENGDEDEVFAVKRTKEGGPIPKNQIFEGDPLENFLNNPPVLKFVPHFQ